MIRVLGDDIVRKFGNLHISGLARHVILVAQRARVPVEFSWQGVHCTVSPDATIETILSVYKGLKQGHLLDLTPSLQSNPDRPDDSVSR